MATSQDRRRIRRGSGSVRASFKRRSSTGSVLGRPSDRASITAWAQGPWARSRQAANTEMPRPAARSTMLSTTRAVHRQPWSLTSLAFSKNSSAHE